ncbi:lamin tail domain-containing protein [Microbacterium sp. SS28]|uniref:lamin tail domain-containing protein n=1 Tax=Microbacterium sp. SS28 TaxID=2919948 RepID=UPI001FAA5FE9|nr:lamin tail domain-containing protein [Microbacterium sp. SS28]
MLRPLAATSLVLALLIAGVPPAHTAERADAALPGDVAIAEIAASGPGGPSQGFFELRNESPRTVDLSGWSVFRCSDEGLRAKPTASDALLDSVVLAPGETFLVAHMSARLSARPNAVFTQAMSPRGFGLVLLAPDGAVADSVAVYASDDAPALSECGDEPLPVALAEVLDESWQRTGEGEWVRARATPGGANAQEPDTLAESGIRIDEIAAAGPGGHGDDLVELRNTGTDDVDVSGWRLYRCTAEGVASADTLQHTFEAGRTIGPGERVVIGGPEFTGRADARTRTSLADVVSGVLLTTPDGRRVDGVTVSSQHDTACQIDAERLPAILDHRTGESWQRTSADSWVVAPRTPGATNAARDDRLPVDGFAYPAARGVAISELATDPRLARSGYTQHAYVELGNYGVAAADVSGWRLIACGADGYRSAETLATIPDGTRLPAGRTWLAALAGTRTAASADAVFDTPFELAGAGMWLEDAEGRRVDSVGVYHRNEMDESVERASPCTKGLALATFSVDRLRGETYQRAGFTGDDASDFVEAAATPGAIDERPPVEPARLLAQAGTAATSALATPSRAARLASTRALTGPPAQILEAFAGASAAPLVARTAPDERRSAPAASLARDDGYGLPYLRLRIAIPAAGGDFTWSGRTVGRSAVRLSAWDPDAGAWRRLDEKTGAATAATAEAAASVVLTGRVRAAEVVDASAEVLVQVVPRADARVAEAPGIAAPADYDVAITHITDTQYYSEAYPEVYAGEIAWILRNAQARKIGFSIHTGDLIQSWVDPDQREDRARREFAIASELQSALDDAGAANSVLPGNHDNKRGLTDDLFNEYFGPER